MQVQEAPARLCENHSANYAWQTEQQRAAYDHWEVQESGEKADTRNALKGLKSREDTQLSAVYCAQDKQWSADPEIACQISGCKGMLAQPRSQDNQNCCQREADPP